MEKLEWGKLWDAMKAHPDQWIETTEAQFFNHLECTYPAEWLHGEHGERFACGEVHHHTADDVPVYTCFKRVGSRHAGARYFARYLTLAQLREGN